MKRIVGLIFFFVLIIFPIKIYAMSEETEFTDISTNIDFNVGSVYLKSFTITNYANYFNTGNKGYRVNANMYNGYEKEVEIRVTISLYDINRVKLREYDNTYTLVSDNVSLYDEGEEYSRLDDIKYYKIKLELLTDMSVPNENKEENHSYYLETLENNIEVTRDRNIIYNENINVAFEKKTDSFYRYLPIRHIYKLELLKVNCKHTEELDKGINKISLYEKDSFNKYHDLNIKYKYNYGKDYSRNYDSINVYVIDNFDAAIKNAKFKVNLPSIKGLHSIIFYDGNKEIKVDYKKVGNSIEGEIKDVSSKKSIKLNLIFDDGYFTDTKSIIDNKLVMSILLPITSLIVSVIIVLISTKKYIAKSISKKMFENYSSLEVGYLYNDKLDNKDIMSMIISLANAGYLNVNYNKGKYILHKNKEYKGSNEYEKILFNGIFDGKEEIKEEELYDRKLVFIKEIKDKIISDYSVKFYNNYINKYIVTVILSLISLYIVNYRILSVFDNTYLIIGMIASFVIYFIIFLIVNNNNRNIEKTISYFSVLVFYVFLFKFIILPSIMVSKLYIVIYIVAILCITASTILYKAIPKRKRKINMVMKDINKLRKDIYDNKISEDLFYDVLPYAYATDLFDCHVNNFKYVKFPMWYEDQDKDYKKMCERIKELLANITYDLTHDDIKG